MKKHILLPTDFSDNAWSATVYALKLFNDEECTFYFLNSTKMKASSMSNISNRLLEAMSRTALDNLTELKEMAETTNANANHTFEIILSAADIQVAIDLAIAKHHINLVVMGTKGATGAKEIFFGSNTVRVIKKTKQCPLLIVPDNFNFEIPSQIAFPTDFTRHYSDRELKYLRELIELYDSKLRVVCILSKDKLTGVQEYNMTMLESYIENYDYSFHFMPNYAKKTEEINDFIELLEINMLVMVNYKHSFIEGIIKEPVINKIGFHPIVPFYVIPD
ncbi:Nucleotide-binding universal stress protein, UspA family [Formosa sp. Hel1_31_208]|uniref:universal stress protein n=1 Tax=Formosa sp. Hel1_31_208 TaxID=1798225 RepID=UPI00087BD318|nr:universal stress protein [Formosa sp. Hel1_31_208]SDS17345.1 Nucleotide-binding universal stress protein, UspA family [Formosa sp. Hel1_31_208]